MTRLAKKTAALALAVLMLLGTARAALAEGLFPSMDALFGVTMPDIRFAVGREADSVENTAEGQQFRFQSFTAEEYEAFGRYAAAGGLSLKSQNKLGETLLLELEKEGAVIVFQYQHETQAASLLYPSGVRLEREKNEAPLGESLFPDLSLLFGREPMPSLGAVLHRYPDSEISQADGSTVHAWTNVTEADFVAFSIHLADQGAELKDYSVQNGVLESTIERNGRSFRFSYNPDQGSAAVIYPQGTYDERCQEAQAHYDAAKEHMGAGRYAEAREEFLQISDYETYRDVAGLLADPNLSAGTAEPSVIPEPGTASVVPGSILIFGHYEQDNSTANGKEPIEWQVLDVQDGKALLLACHALDGGQMYSRNVRVAWKDSLMRAWMNADFMQAAFSAGEQEAIVSTTLDNSPSQGNYEFPNFEQEDTVDKVFCLSYQEVLRYMPTVESRLCTATPYAVSHEAFVHATKGTTWWWLRSPGEVEDRTAGIHASGGCGASSNSARCGIRPALWIDLSSDAYTVTGRMFEPMTFPETASQLTPTPAPAATPKPSSGGSLPRLQFPEGFDVDGIRQQLEGMLGISTPGAEEPETTSAPDSGLPGNYSLDELLDMVQNWVDGGSSL